MASSACRVRVGLAVTALVLGATCASAAEPDGALIPRLRPATVSAPAAPPGPAVSAGTGGTVAAEPPRLRPGANPAPVASAAPAISTQTTGKIAAEPPRLPPWDGPAATPRSQKSGSGTAAGAERPRLRPGSVASGPAIVAVSGTGALCGRRTVVGQRLRPIGDAACGIAEPVRVQSVSGVAVSPPSVMGCDEAVALDDWISRSAAPAWGRLGRGLGQVSVGTGFSCKGADAPGHGSGEAVDVTGFTLRNGIEVPVAKGWRDPVAGQVLRTARDGACKVFTQVLSPDAGRAQAGSLHLSVQPDTRRRCR